MSTDMQRYSIESQCDAIAQYASLRGLVIVRTYEDAGRSGLSLDGRDGLKRLFDDIQSGRADFKTVLVYDVSRWGRFQDSDESAHYEFVCRRAGVTVEYCAEQFDNDGSIVATVLKNIKRAMAGEFSRELSVKVFAGQSRIASKGFHVGAEAGYGLRRYLVDESGNPKMLLTKGQRKNVKSERVILVPGPAEELKTLDLVYHLFIDLKQSLNSIARTLNAEQVAHVNGGGWSSVAVRQLLANEKYIGSCVYNRSSKKLGAKWRPNPRSQWITAPEAFEPVVSVERFEAAQKQLKDNASGYTEHELLDILTAIWCRHGMLSKGVIEATPNAPSINTFRQHFGGLTNAYQRIGFARMANRGGNRNLRNAICDEIAKQVSKRGGMVRTLSANCQIRINEEFTVGVGVGRMAAVGTRWRIGYRSRQKPDVLIVARVKGDGNHVTDFFVVPYLLLPHGRWLTVSGLNYRRLERFRTPTLEPFFELCSRQLLKGQ